MRPAADAEPSKTPIDEDDHRVPGAGETPLVVPGAVIASPPAKENPAGAGADMGPAGGPDGGEEH